jgi:hypothetical protein
MEEKLRERDRDVARQVENVKTQAVFAVSHCVPSQSSVFESLIG